MKPFQHTIVTIFNACRHIHHSAERHRFYSNRFYKKKCRNCGRPNIVPVIACGYCNTPLTDADIHFVGRDDLRRCAASRMPNHSQIGSICSFGIERSATWECKTQTARPPATSTWRHGTTVECLSPAVRSAAPVLCVSGKKEYYRSFNFLVCQYPYPVAAIHLTAIMKGTVYDVKQLRRSHIPLLQSMHRTSVAVIEELVDTAFINQLIQEVYHMQFKNEDARDSIGIHGGLACRSIHTRGKPIRTETQYSLPINDNLTGSRNNDFAIQHRRIHPVNEADASEAVALEAKTKMKKNMIFGFTYPCEYDQVNMHAIVPPIYNLNMMRSPYFIPLKKVFQDLQEYGMVQSFERESRVTKFGGDDPVLKEIENADASIQQLFHVSFSALVPRVQHSKETC